MYAGYAGRVGRRCTSVFQRKWKNGYAAGSFDFMSKLLHWRKGNDLFLKVR